MAPDFDSKAEALAHAQALIAQLKAAGYSVTLVDETAGGTDPPSNAHDGKSGGTGEEVQRDGGDDVEIVAWLKKTAGQAAAKLSKKTKAKKPIPAAVTAKLETLLSEAEAADADNSTGSDAEAQNAGFDSAGGDADGTFTETALIVPPPTVSAAEMASSDLVTPLSPDLWDAARETGAAGVPLLMGGEDLEDMQATVVVYRDPNDPDDKGRPVVWCKVRPQAEEKIMAAVAAAQGKQYITVKKQLKMSGRALFDSDFEVAEKIVTYAKSINHHVGEGTPIPQHTISGVSTLMEYLEKQAANPDLSDGERKLLDGYRQDVQELADAIAAVQKTPRKDYGPRTGTFMHTIEELVPVPLDPSAGPQLAVQEREATRISADEKDGIARWDGHSRDTPWKNAKEIAIDFGDGWTAVYRPHNTGYGIPWSHKGTLEVHAPPGADPTGIAEHLNRLYLHGEPMSKIEAEAIYLERNAWAQGLAGTKEHTDIQRYVAARTQSLAAELVMSGEYEPDDSGMAAAVRTAGRIALREKVVLLRRMFEQKMGLPEGGLAKLPQYKPEPVWEQVRTAGGKASPGGYFVWNRFDVDPEKVKKLFNGKVLGHSLTGKDLYNAWSNLRRIILGNGILAAQEKRRQMGIEVKSMSPGTDTETGGAAYVFLRVGKPGQFDIEWDPAILLQRSDWFFRDEDNYGATNPSHYLFKVAPSTDPKKAAEAKSAGNEVCFKNGIGLFGRFAPIRINAGDFRDSVLHWFKSAGITHLGGRPVEEVVK